MNSYDKRLEHIKYLCYNEFIKFGEVAVITFKTFDNFFDNDIMQYVTFNSEVKNSDKKIISIVHPARKDSIYTVTKTIVLNIYITICRCNIDYNIGDIENYIDYGITYILDSSDITFFKNRQNAIFRNVHIFRNDSKVVITISHNNVSVNTDNIDNLHEIKNFYDTQLVRHGIEVMIVILLKKKNIIVCYSAHIIIFKDQNMSF